MTISAPEIAENGNTVPIEVDAPGAVEITLFADGNPVPNVATFKFGPLSASRSASTRIRLAGEGEAGQRGGPPGDLYIFLEMAEHPLFERDGMDLFCRIPVPMTTAALGGEIEAPTIDGGKSRVKIPAGSQSGKQLRLRAKGMPQLRGGKFGDLYLELQVETPVNLTAHQKELLQMFEQASKENSPESEDFFSKVKSFWDGMTS